MTPLFIILGIIIFFLAMLRGIVVAKAFDQWNYYAYRYKNYCAVNYSEEEKHPKRVAENEVTKIEGIIVFISIWKFNPDLFFDFKPDHSDIFEMYYLKR